MSEENISSYSESSSSDEVDTFDDLGVDEESNKEGNELGLSPFMFEPERSEEAQVLMENLNTETLIKEQQESRIGHTNWCSCEKCKTMLTTDEESLCCRDTNDIPDNHFQGLH